MDTIPLSDKSYLIQGHLDLEYDYNQLYALHPTTKDYVKIADKLIPMPRFCQSYGSAYTFSNIKHEAVAIPPLLQPFLDWANQTIGSQFQCQFNTMFVNWYENGNNYIGSHHDDEKTHTPGSPIISISLGATRKFRIRNNSKKIVLDIDMIDKSYVIMCGAMQQEYYHEVVKIGGKKGLTVGSRINITIRSFI